MKKQRRHTNRQYNQLARRRSSAARRSTSRGLFAEQLEDRRLLASDFPYHNDLAPMDVTKDWNLSPRDALAVINQLNTSGSKSLAPANGSSSVDFMVDTNKDNALSPLDALLVVNALNDGEGLDKLVGVSLELQNANGVKIEPVNGALRVKVGDTFRLQILVDDLRTDIVTEKGGVFAAAMDVGYNDPSLFSMNGTKVDDFTDIAAFKSFFTAHKVTFPNPLPPPQFITKTFYSQDFLNQPNQSVTNPPLSLDAVKVPNELNEVYTFSPNTDPIGADKIRFVYVTLKADNPGTLTFTANESDLLANGKNNETLLYGTIPLDPNDPNSPQVTQPIPASQIDFGFPLTITITQPVNAVNDAFPVPPNAILEDSAAVTLDVLANDFLETGSTGTKALGAVTQPANGTTSIVGSTIQYKPNLNYFGPDTFTYTAIDGLGNSDTATVTVTVTSVNDPPVAGNDSATVAEDSGANTINVLNNDNGGPANEDQALTINSVTQPAHGSVVLIDGNTKVQYTPVQDYFGSDSFQYTVVDSDGAVSNLATVSITVTDVNDPPVAQNDQVLDVVEDTPKTINVLANDNGGPANEVQTLTIDPTTLTQPSHGTVALTDNNTRVLYTPAQDYFGGDSFQYSVIDNGGLKSNLATVTLTVTDVNDPVVAVADKFDVDELTQNNSLDVLGNDSPGPNENRNTMTISAVTTPNAGGTVRIAQDQKSLIYTPQDGKLGLYTETFQYTMTDGQFSSTATVTIDVVPVIRPRARDDQYSVTEDSANNPLNVQSNDLFNAGATRNLFVVTVQPLHGTATIDNKGTTTLDDDVIVYTPNADYFGPDTLTYQVDDDYAENGNESVASEATVTITVTNVNDNPTANDDSTFPAVLEDTTNNPLDVLANDSILPDANETLTITKVGSTADSNDGKTSQGGTVTISAGKVLYTPKADFFGTDTFTYAISDGNGGTDSATVTVTVDNVNDNPTANDDNTFPAVQEDSSDNPLDVLANDTFAPDVEETLTITSVGANAAGNDGLTSRGGTVSIASDQLSVLYTPLDDFFGTDTFTYTISDGNGGTSKATVTVVVNDVNDDPTANDDQLMALKNFVNQELAVLSNDSIVPDVGETLTITSVGSNLDGDDGTTSEGGVVSISADGKRVLYTPKADFESGTTGPKDTFTYTISDGRGGTSTATVEVDVLEAVPTDISGVIYLDVNNNGVRDPQEVELAGVDVTLTGTNLRGLPVDQTVKTDVNGEFKFVGVLPNAEGDTLGYKISAATPKFLIDGIDSIVNPDVQWNDVNNDGVRDANELYNPGVAHNDQFTGIDLGLFGTQAAKMNYAFGERGLSSKYISLSQYLASSKTGLAAATNMQGQDFWFTVLQGWEGVQSVHVQLVKDPVTQQLTTALLSINGEPAKEISYKDFHLAGDSATGDYLIYFRFSKAEFDLMAANSEGEAEGEASEMYAADFARDADDVFTRGDWA